MTDRANDTNRSVACGVERAVSDLLYRCISLPIVCSKRCALDALGFIGAIREHCKNELACVAVASRTAGTLNTSTSSSTVCVGGFGVQSQFEMRRTLAEVQSGVASRRHWKPLGTEGALLDVLKGGGSTGPRKSVDSMRSSILRPSVTGRASLPASQELSTLDILEASQQVLGSDRRGMRGQSRLSLGGAVMAQPAVSATNVRSVLEELTEPSFGRSPTKRRAEFSNAENVNPNSNLDCSRLLVAATPVKAVFCPVGTSFDVTRSLADPRNLAGNSMGHIEEPIRVADVLNSLPAITSPADSSTMVGAGSSSPAVSDRAVALSSKLPIQSKRKRARAKV